jgi:predicted dehydrogenase
VTHATGDTTDDTVLGIGIVGCGNIAARMHLPAWQELGHLVRVVAVADPDPDARERLRQQAGLAVTDSYEDAGQLIERDDVCIVDVCTPQAFRRDILVAAARAGKHILVEKPLATTPADGAAAVEAAAAHGTLLGIVHNFITVPETVAAQEVIESGEIGEVRSVVSNYLGVVYEAGAAGDWRRDPALSGGGVLTDMLHGVYQAEALVGEPIRRVKAYISAPGPESQVEDLAACVFETDHRVAVVNIGWGLGPGGIVVTGTLGRIEIRYEDGGTAPWANLDHVRVTTAAGTREVMGPATERRVGLGDFPSHTVAFRRLALAFAEAAHGRGEPVATGADGLRGLESVIGAYLSAATGETVTIPLDRTSAPFLRGAMGVPELATVDWSPYHGTKLFRPNAFEERES